MVPCSKQCSTGFMAGVSFYQLGTLSASSCFAAAALMRPTAAMATRATKRPAAARRDALPLQSQEPIGPDQETEGLSAGRLSRMIERMSLFPRVPQPSASVIQVKLLEAVDLVLGHEAASDVVLLAAPPRSLLGSGLSDSSIWWPFGAAQLRRQLSPLWTPLGLLLGRAMAEEGAAIALVLTSRQGFWPCSLTPCTKCRAAPACFRF